jgi:hypothetical protein
MTASQLRLSGELRHRMDASFQSLSSELNDFQSGILDLIRTELRSLRNAPAVDAAFGKLPQTAPTQSSSGSTSITYFQQGTPQVSDIPSLEIQRSSQVDIACNVSWRSMRYSFPTGYLQIDHTESLVHSKDSIRARCLSKSEREKRWRFAFSPPEWFSKRIVQVELSQRGALMPTLSVGQAAWLDRTGLSVSQCEDLQMLPLLTQFRLMALNQDIDPAFAVCERTTSWGSLRRETNLQRIQCIGIWKTTTTILRVLTAMGRATRFTGLSQP